MSRLNVLLVMVDHWPGRLLGIGGHPVAQTPTLDPLARSGTRFSRAYSECPVCVPARRTLMTGTAPRTHGDRAMSSQSITMLDLLAGVAAVGQMSRIRWDEDVRRQLLEPAAVITTSS